MKIIIIYIAMLLSSSLTGAAQSIPPAPAGKAVVYFVRPSSMGFAINFTYFDSTKLIGSFNAPKYIRYECEPGKHLFWARSENKDFVEADVEAGKIYFLEAVSLMGAVKAQVALEPIDPTNDKKMGKILKLLNRRSPESFTNVELADLERKFEDVIERGMDKYKDDKTKGKTFPHLDSTMYYAPQ